MLRLLSSFWSTKLKLHRNFPRKYDFASRTLKVDKIYSDATLKNSYSVTGCKLRRLHLALTEECLSATFGFKISLQHCGHFLQLRNDPDPLRGSMWETRLGGPLRPGFASRYCYSHRRVCPCINFASNEYKI